MKYWDRVKLPNWHWSWCDSVRHQLYEFAQIKQDFNGCAYDCPYCGEIGTFRAYGGWYANAEADRQEIWTKLNLTPYYRRRWLCKHCGTCVSSEIGFKCCAPNAKTGVWGERTEDSKPTPKEASIINGD